ncbi:hypothetical protein BLA29_014068 [Euroglyphus maynei]|uniref:Uncharacterized protein n=1 Tax=Euroglyphus maynei TaxID=6958 RepID=A0A1Y3ASH1_EURMA|nr:hypothetical protein BLA29_014068 [Euroglyphus maynei]
MAASVRTPLQTVHESGPHEQFLLLLVLFYLYIFFCICLCIEPNCETQNKTILSISFHIIIIVVYGEKHLTML